MVVSPATHVRSVNAGEFDPDAQARYDIKQYYSGATRMKGFEPVPQSGFRLMGGTVHIGVARNYLNSIAITDAAVTGGALDGSDQVIWSGVIDDTVAVVFVKNINLSDNSAEFSIQAQIDGGWTTIKGPYPAGTSALSFTAAFEPGEGQAATGLRILADFTGAAEVSIDSVAAWTEATTQHTPRHVALKADDGTSYSCFVSAGVADFYTSDGYCGSCRLDAITASMVADLGFYAEADTIGIFHPSTVATQRIRRFDSDHAWGIDDWPYEDIPEVDLGEEYEKTDDEWELFFRWTLDRIQTSSQMYISIVVDDDTTPSIAHSDTAGGDAIGFGDFTSDTWDVFAGDIQTALENLASLGEGVTVSDQGAVGPNCRRMTVTFGGDLTGAEYNFSALIPNTSDASVLPTHTQIGETEGEDLFSETRGYPGIAALVSDRLVYGRIPAVTGALALSSVGSYFDLDITGQADSAARLDKLRSQISETVLAVKEAKYMLVFTDRQTYFASNRTIERNTPLTFVVTNEVGIRENTMPIDLDGYVFYVTNNGEQVYSLKYDEFNVGFEANIESLLASHLISGVVRTVRQASAHDQDAAKMWILRDDGRLVSGQIISKQNITGFCEWRTADDGLVREIGVDGDNCLWLSIERDGTIHHEFYDTDQLFQSAVTSTSDLAGLVTVPERMEGATVWAEADGFILGPFTVSDAAIDLGDWFDGDITVGRWIAPIWESLPQPLILRDETILFRPGRIHTVTPYIVDTTSIAIGANGLDAEDFPLDEITDPVDEPMPAKTKRLTVPGLLGSQEGPTVTITQTRPGSLRVRDLGMEAKL